MRRDPAEFRKRFAAYKNGKSPYKAGRPVEDDEFESFRQTLPDNQKPIGGYRTKRYWELNGKPKTFGEAVGLGMYTLGESGKKGQYGMEIPAWHANSVAYDESTGNYEFMKPNTHDTRWMEDVYGYWSPDNEDFRENYKLQKGVVYDKYVPKKNVYEMPKYGSGMPVYKDGKSSDEDDLRAVEAGAAIGASIAGKQYTTKPKSKRARAMYNTIDPTGDYPSLIEALSDEIGVRYRMHFKDPDKKIWKTGPTLGDSVADAAWRKRLGYEDIPNKFLLPYSGDTVRLPKQIEAEIPTDTTMLKNRIAANKKLMDSSRQYRLNPFIKEAYKSDVKALNALRETYKTGKKVWVDETAFNSRNWLDGEEMSPLNVLHNYTIQYDKNANRMYYQDDYDFNEFDWGIPGKSFPIKGYVELKKPAVKSKK